MWGKHCIFPHKTLWIDTNHSIQSLNFLSSTQLFFFFGILTPSYLQFLLLISCWFTIILNIIKHIYFISPWQCVSMPSSSTLYPIYKIFGYIEEFYIFIHIFEFYVHNDIIFCSSNDILQFNLSLD
jgi:hypothetical protein